jgi:molecular chaperone DnaK (HSP70)
MSLGWWLGVDFGTSNTAAAHVDAETGVVSTMPLTPAGSAMPSCAYVESPIRIYAGLPAAERAVADPTGFVATPKRVLTAGAETFHVRTHDVPGRAVVAAVLAAAVAEAATRRGGDRPVGLVLSHPETWSHPQIAVLADAAAAIGYPGEAVRLVTEPAAAAAWFARGATPPPGAAVAVCDIGGGAVEVTVLTMGRAGAFEVVTSCGDSALGGRNLDSAVRRWVHGQLTRRNPRAMDRLRDGGASPADRRALAESIRQARELLSTQLNAAIEVRIGAHQERFTLARAEFEKLIEPELARIAELARTALDSAHDSADSGPIRPPIYLIGGPSRTPAVRRALESLSTVVVPDDPQAVVACGALIAAGAHADAHRPRPAPRQLDTPPEFAPPPTRRGRLLRRIGSVVFAGLAVTLSGLAPHPGPTVTEHGKPLVVQPAPRCTRR